MNGNVQYETRAPPFNKGLETPERRDRKVSFGQIVEKLGCFRDEITDAFGRPPPRIAIVARKMGAGDNVEAQLGCLLPICRNASPGVKSIRKQNGASDSVPVEPVCDKPRF